ncbi:MAG: polysaccharide deacetylase family protein [Gemmatimonadales bacterium]|nr:MAG: polysaccharide deacetylase family protein [Gemmatimonadales bacterium]
MSMKRVLPLLLSSGLLTACASDAPLSPSTPWGVAPTITITFDDAREGVYLYAYPILKQHGMTANTAVVTGTWTDSLRWPNHITIAQAKTLSADGWSIVSHSVNHKVLSDLAVRGWMDSVRFELRTSKRLLDSLHFHGTKVFIVPNLLWDDSVQNEIRAVYSMSRCCTQSWYSLDTLSALPEHKTDPAWYALTGLDISNYADTLLDQTYNFATPSGRSNILLTLNEVVDHNKFIDIIVHDVTAADSSEFRKMVEMLDDSRFRPHLMTYAQIKK